MVLRIPSIEKLSIKDLKIGIPIEYNCEYLSKAVLDVWNATAKALQEAGAKVKEVILG